MNVKIRSREAWINNIKLLQNASKTSRLWHFYQQLIDEQNEIIEQLLIEERSHNE